MTTTPDIFLDFILLVLLVLSGWVTRSFKRRVGGWQSIEQFLNQLPPLDKRSLQPIQQEQMELALKASQSRFAGILDIANYAIISVDGNQRITLFNQGAEKIFGYSPCEAIGQPLELLLPVHMVSVHHQPLHGFRTDSPEARQMGERREIWGRRKDGTEFPAEVSISQLEIDGEVIFTAFLQDITDRKQAEENLARLAAIVESSEDAVISHALDGTILSWNAAAERMLGYSATEAIGQPITILMPAEENAEFTLLLHKIQQGDRINHFETVRRCKNDQLIQVSVSLSPIRNSSGNVVGISSIQRNITAQKEVARALKESEARFHTFMDRSPMAAWITNEHGQILYLNQTYYQMFNIPDTYVAGETTDVTLHPSEIRKQYLENIQRVIATNQAIETIEPGIRKDGTSGEYLVYKFPIPNSAGQSLVGGIAVDISDRQQIEDRLRYSELTREALIAAIPDLLIRMKADGSYLEFVAHNDFNIVNPTQMREGLTVFEVLPPEMAETRVNAAQLALKTGKIQTYEQQLWIGGQLFYEEVRIVPVDTDQVLTMIRNITDRKQAELALQHAKEAAETANRAKSRFLANMSHELRTPLNVILGFTQLMERDASLTPDQQETVQIMHRSGEHLLALINDILDLSKIEAGHTTLNETCFDLTALLNSLHDMMHQRAVAKGLVLQINTDPETPQSCTADVVKLRQVLINLLNNAIKFTDQGYVILRIGVTEDQQQLLFTVEDTGIGIDPNETETIFDAFTQSLSGKSTPDGTGLGLTISRNFVRLMGGEITVKSALGQGSVFHVHIPVQWSKSQDIPVPEPQPQVMGLAPDQPIYRILVVDDQPENRLLLIRLMEEVGMEVREASNGQEAVALWQGWQPHLIWMDIRMPIMDGYEATRTIQSRSTGQAPVIIALTAHASKGDRTLALSVGCNDFVTKPFQKEMLYEKMAQYLGLQFQYSDFSQPLLSSQSSPGQEALCLCECFSAMAGSWVSDLYHAAQLCDEEEVTYLIRQIPGSHAPLAEFLTQLAHDYQFSRIQHFMETCTLPE